MNQHSGRIAAIDYGTVRLGIAVSDPAQTLASPYENYTRRDPQQDARYLQRIVADEGIIRFVVGLPVHLDGHESQKSQESRQFGKWLEEQTGIPVDFYDERFTSVEAAQLLLTAYLESDRDADTENPGSLG